MKLPLDPSRIVRARLYTATQDGVRRNAGGCNGYGHRLRRSCVHDSQVTCPLCQRDVPYRSLPGRVVEVGPHPRGDH